MKYTKFYKKCYNFSSPQKLVNYFRNMFCNSRKIYNKKRVNEFHACSVATTK